MRFNQSYPFFFEVSVATLQHVCYDFNGIYMNCINLVDAVLDRSMQKPE